MRKESGGGKKKTYRKLTRKWRDREISKSLKDEIKGIVKERPTSAERAEEKLANNAKHAAEKKKIHFFPKKTGYKIAMLLMALVVACFFMSLIVLDALPTDLTFLLVALVIISLVTSSILMANSKKGVRITGIIIAVIFAALFTFATGFMANTYAMLNKISDGGTQATGPIAKGVVVTEEPFNVYITGIDQWASEKGLDLERSDVNMLVTVNPTTKKILLTSIPRDTYVKLHTSQQMDKLTHSGIYGVDETINTVQDWLGVDINYYVKMNFTGMCAIVDALDGIDVYTPVDFESSIKGYKYKKGWNHLYGRKALYFARERKSFEGQDSARVENQQRVVKAIIKKMTSSTTILTRYGDVMDAAGDNLETNMSPMEMKELVKMQITEIPTWDVETQKIEGEVDQDYVASLTQSQKFDIYRPKDESVASVSVAVNTVMNPSEEEIKEAEYNRNKSFFLNAIRRITKMGEKNNSEE